MNALSAISQFFSTPFNSQPDPEGELSCSQSLISRLLHVAQLISSLVALPILFMIGLSEATIQLCKGDQGHGFKLFVQSLKKHLALRIPISVIGLFAPRSTTIKCEDSFSHCLKITS